MSPHGHRIRQIPSLKQPAIPRPRSRRRCLDYILGQADRHTIFWESGGQAFCVPSPGLIFWQTADTVAGDITAEQGREVYTNITVNGKKAKSLPANGAWSGGEFASALLEILVPKSDALFTNQRPDLIREHSAYQYDYVIDQAHSTWNMVFQAGRGPIQHYLPEYAGGIWIDMQSHQVLRITRRARALPTGFGLDSFTSVIDYDSVKIGDGCYLLPIHSDDVICVRGTIDCFRNETFFQDYNKFVSKTSISFEDGGK